MFKHNPRSRIPRELFYTLESMATHLRSLLRMSDNQSVKISHVLVLLGIYMLREEGKKTFQKRDLSDNTPLPKSSVYKIIDWFADHGILKNDLGEYMCMSRTPKFLLNPEELYQRPIETVVEKDYKDNKEEGNIMTAIMELKESIPTMIKNELSRQIVTIPTVGSSGEVNYPVGRIPPKKKTIDLVDLEAQEKKKKPKNLKDKLGGDMFL